MFFLSSRQTAGVITSDPTAHFYIFKSFHLIEYAILSIFLFLGFRLFGTTIFVSYLYAISDEIHQYFTPGRSPALRDTIVDVVGITMGIIVTQILLQIKPIKKAIYN